VTDLDWEVAGEGDRTFLLIHCGLGDRSFWDHVVPELARDGRVVTYDQRAFGRSPDPTGSFSPAQDAVDVLDAAGAERAVVVGCSYGSRVALETAIGFPERVEKLVLVSGPGEDDEHLAKQLEQVDALLEDGDFDGANAIEVEVWAKGASEDALAWVTAQNRALLERQAELEHEPVFLEPDALKRLDEVRAPTLVLLGERDQPSTIRTAKRVAESVPDGRAIDVPDAGHLLGREQPDALVAAVRDFAR